MALLFNKNKHNFLRALFFFSSRRRHTRCSRDWSSDVCSSDLTGQLEALVARFWHAPSDHGSELRSRIAEHGAHATVLWRFQPFSGGILGFAQSVLGSPRR